MIGTEFRQKFKAELGENFRYSAKVKSLLEASETYNQNGEPYSRHSISNVFNGLAENEDIELAIYQMFEKEIERRKKLAALRTKHSKKKQSLNK